MIQAAILPRAAMVDEGESFVVCLSTEKLTCGRASVARRLFRSLRRTKSSKAREAVNLAGRFLFAFGSSIWCHIIMPCRCVYRSLCNTAF